MLSYDPDMLIGYARVSTDDQNLDLQRPGSRDCPSGSAPGETEAGLQVLRQRSGEDGTWEHHHLAVGQPE